MTDGVYILIDDQLGAVGADGSPTADARNFLSIVGPGSAEFRFCDAWSPSDQVYSEFDAVSFLSQQSPPIRCVIVDMMFGSDVTLGLRIADNKFRYKILQQSPTVLMTSHSRQMRVQWRGEDRSLGSVIQSVGARYLSKSCLSDGRKFWRAIRRIELDFARSHAAVAG